MKTLVESGMHSADAESTENAPSSIVVLSADLCDFELDVFFEIIQTFKLSTPYHVLELVGH